MIALRVSRWQRGLYLVLALILLFTTFSPAVEPALALSNSHDQALSSPSTRVLPGWWRGASSASAALNALPVGLAWRPPLKPVAGPAARLLASSITTIKITDGASETATEILTKTLTADEAFTFYAVGYDPAFTGTQVVTWTLSNPGIGLLSATRAASTTLAAQTVGWSILTATLVTTPTISTTARITVTPGAAASLVLAPASETVTAGQALTYSATAYDQDSNLVGDVTGSTVFDIDAAAGGSWTANEYTSEKAGDWTVTGSYTNTNNDLVTDTANLTVNAGALATITVAPPAVELVVGEQQSFSASGTDQFGNPVSVAPAWSSSDIGTIDGSGLFTARQSPPGTGVVTATQDAVSGQATVTATHGPVTSFYFSPTQIATQTAGVDFPLTVEARDVYSNVATSYNGTANLSDSTGTVAPGAISFADGVWTGVVSVTLAADGVVITATDGTTRGHSSAFAVLPADLDYFTLAGYPASTVAGVAFPDPVVVTAYDRFDNLKTNYQGTVAFSSSDVSATLPGDYSFTLGDAGAHSFPASQFVLFQTPNQVITVTDGAAGVSQASNSIEVIPAELDYFALTGYPASTVAGETFPMSVTVRAFDRFDNLKTNYTGTVAFSSDDVSATLPGDYQFLLGDAGAHDFDDDAFILYQSISRTITVQDQTLPVSETSEVIEVVPAALDRFEIGTIATQEAGIAFQLTITAFDQWDNAKYNYGGTPGLSDDTGTLSPDQTASGCFATDGVCEQSVTITRAQSADQITVVDGLVQVVSELFDVTPTSPDHVRINSAADNGGASFDYPVEVGARETDIYETHTFWAACYDQYDNYRADVSADWGLTGVLAQGTIAPNPAISATLTPAPILSGTGTITASAATCGTSDETGAFHVKAPLLVITKSDDPDPVPAAGYLNFTIVYTNVGNAVAQSVRITETYDPNVSYVTAFPAPSVSDNIWALTSLGVGESKTINLTVRVDNSIISGTLLTNQVTAGGSRLGESTAVETTVVTSTPELTLTLSSQPSPVDAGDNLVYQIRYANNGTAPVSNVRITMTYDSDVTFLNSTPAPETGTDNVWVIGDLAGGASGEIDVTVVVDDLMQDQDVLISRATIDSDEEPSFADVEYTGVNAPVLALTKVATPSPVDAFSRLTYTLFYSNVGHAAASALVITDAVPINTDYVSCLDASCSRLGDIVTWQPGGLAAGAGGSVRLLVDVHRNLDTGTVLTNGARVRVFATPGYSATTQITTTVVSTPSLWVQISDDRTGVEAGDSVVYALDYGNDGNGRAYSATIVATPPVSYVDNLGCLPTANCHLDGGKAIFDLGTVDGGQTGKVRMVVDVDDPLPADADSIMASAVISTVTPGDPLGDNTDQDVDSILTLPDLVVQADYEDLMPYPGKRVTYTVHYENVGHKVVNGVVVTVTQPQRTTFDPAASDPGWSWQGDGRYRYSALSLSLNEGGDLLFVVTLTSTQFNPGITDFDATFEVFGDALDDEPSDNVLEAPLGVPNLKIESAVADNTIWGGMPGFLTVTVRNVGPGTACGVYDADGDCTGFALDPFLDPTTPPASYPLQEFGDCFIFVGPLGPGVAETAVISFTLDPALPGAYPGYCRAAPVAEMWFKIDNWDPRAPPNPGPAGLVPEHNEEDNVLGPFTLDYRIFLPILLRND